MINEMMKEKVERLRQWRAGIPAGPITMEINPTNRCNLTCTSCWQREFEYDEKDYLSTERLLSLVREASEIGVKEVRIPGAGEPMLRTDLFEIMEEIKRFGMHGLLINNGTAWTEEKIQRVVAMGWDCLTFSIDGPNPETNDALRGKPGTFALITKNLRRLSTVKKEQGSDLPLIRFNMVLSNKNYRQLTEMVEFANEYDCKDLQVQPMTVWGDDGRPLALSEEQRAALPRHVKPALELAKKYGIFTNMGAFLSTSIVANAGENMDKAIAEQTSDIEDQFLSLPCFEPFYNLVILPDGTASFCSVSGGKDGDSILHKSLKEVWQGNAYQTIRATLLNKNLRDYCSRCCSVVNMENNRIRKSLISVTT